MAAKSSLQKLYWCGDDSFRGCILRTVFANLGYRVIIPAGPPSLSTGKVPKKGSMFKLIDVSKFLSSRNCNEIANIDEQWGISLNAKGDIDFAAEISPSVAYVAEVKTRLVPRSLSNYSLNIARLMLQYHLDEPVAAERAWKLLVELGIVKPPKPGIRGGYDNPASIAELVRSLVGFTLLHRDYNAIVPGVATLCYAAPLLNDMYMYIRNVYHYLLKCDLPVREPAILVVYPQDFSGLPLGFTVECLGGGCSYLKLRRNMFIDSSTVFKGCPSYKGCNECQYRRICMNYCRK